MWGKQVVEVEGADFSRSIASTDPKESDEENKVEEAGERFRRVRVHNPGNRVGFQFLKTRAGAGALLPGRRPGNDFLKKLKNQRKERLLQRQRTRVGNPQGLALAKRPEPLKCDGEGKNSIGIGAGGALGSELNRRVSMTSELEDRNGLVPVVGAGELRNPRPDIHC